MANRTPASVAGTQVASVATEKFKIRDVDTIVRRIRSNKTSFTRYMSSLKSRDTKTSKFELLFKEPVPVRGQVAAGLSFSGKVAGDAVTLNLGTNTTSYFVQDDQILFPKNGAIVRVTGSGNMNNAVDCTVVKAAAGATDAEKNIATSDMWLQIGDARAALSRIFDQSTGNLNANGTVETIDYNYVQRFRQAWGIDRREGNSADYRGDLKKEAILDATINHAAKLELAFVHGVRSTTTNWYDMAQTNDRTRTGGAISFIQADNTIGISLSGATDVTAFGDNLDTLAAIATEYAEDGDEHILWCSKVVAGLISRMARDAQRITRVGEEIKYGVQVTTYLTGIGVPIKVAVADHALKGLDGTYGSGLYGSTQFDATTGKLNGKALLVNMNDKKIVKHGGVYLKAHEYDEKLMTIDGQFGEIMSDCGYDPGDPRKDAMLVIG